MSEEISPNRGSEITSSEMQLESGAAHPIRIWYERLLLFVAGVGFGGFCFGGTLRTVLSPPKRPAVPEPALGYTYLFKAKYGSVYGTFFEYLFVPWGLWLLLIIGAVSMLWFSSIEPKSRVYPRYPWQVFAAFVTSIFLYYACWQLSIYAAR